LQLLSGPRITSACNDLQGTPSEEPVTACDLNACWQLCIFRFDATNKKKGNPPEKEKERKW
jgi:hypothetical protein